MIKGFEGCKPEIHKNTFIANSADIIGNVIISENANIWYNSVLRAEHHVVSIGENTNIQDGCVIHNGDDFDTIIGKNVTVGHKALVHGCIVGDNTLIGMGAIVLDGAEIGEFTLIGAGSLVPPGKKIPSGVLAMGSPVKVIRELTEVEKENLLKSAENYVKESKLHID